jgi:hypothetical protein
VSSDPFASFLSGQVAAAKESAAAARHLPPASNLPPEERYLGRELIGEGGQKRIYKCRDLVAGREVALALPLAGADEASLARFRREGRIASLLEHPNILPVYDLGLLPGAGPFFTMRLASRCSLGEALAGGRIDFPEAIAAMVSVCLALECAHSHGISHFDVKPANIQLGQHGEVLLCDWGLAGISYETCSDKVMADEELRRIDLACFVDATVEGTPGFAAPEIWKAGAERGPWSDIFSLGKLLEAVLTAFAAEAPGLRAVAAKASAELAGNRYASVTEFRLELERFRGGFATGAEAAGPGRLLWLLAKRQPVAVAAVALLLVGIPLVMLDMRSRQLAAEELAARLETERRAKEELQAHELPWLIQEATRLYRERHYDEAAAQLPLMRSIDSRHPKIGLLDAFLRIHRGDWEGAAARLPPQLRDKLPDLQEGSLDGLLAFLEKLDVKTEPESCLYRNLITERFPQFSDLEDKKRLALAEWRLKLKDGEVPRLHLAKVRGGLEIDVSGNPGLASFGPLNRFTSGRRLAKVDLSGCDASFLPSFSGSSIDRLVLDQTVNLQLSSLASVPIRHLSLKNLGRQDFDFRGLQAEEVDLRGSEASRWSELRQIQKLRRVIVESASEELRAALPPGVQLDERPKPQ